MICIVVRFSKEASKIKDERNFLTNKFNLFTCTKEKNKKPETRNSENNICFPFGMIHKIRFSLIECDDSQIICYLFPSLY